MISVEFGSKVGRVLVGGKPRRDPCRTVGYMRPLMSDNVATATDIIWIECDVDILAVGIKVGALVPVGNAADFRDSMVDICVEPDIYAVIVTLVTVGIDSKLRGSPVVTSQLIRRRLSIR